MSTLTKGPWRWMNENTLVADHGSRRAILTASTRRGAPALSQCDSAGFLEQFDPKSLNAKAIEASGEMLEAMRKIHAATLRSKPTKENDEIQDIVEVFIPLFRLLESPQPGPHLTPKSPSSPEAK